MQVIDNNQQYTQDSNLPLMQDPMMQGGMGQPTFDPRMYPDMSNPYQGAVFPNQDQSFLQWLFNFRKEAVLPLRNVWRGFEFDYQTNKWVKNPHSDCPDRIMNERGITWCISLIESYLSPVFIVTDFDTVSYNFTMREACRFIWNNLCLRFRYFDIRKSDIPRVAEEIESKIRAILLGAKNNGYRDFFSTQNQNIETRNLTPMMQKKTGIMESMANMFRRAGQNPGHTDNSGQMMY